VKGGGFQERIIGVRSIGKKVEERLENKNALTSFITYFILLALRLCEWSV